MTNTTLEQEMHQQNQSRLLQLPAELVLTIFEYAVIETEPLLVNCAYDSSYRKEDGWEAQMARWEADRRLWKAGEKLPPLQPGLTRTCSLIRNITLLMFYQKNAFRAHHHYESDLGGGVRWLRMIGPENRCLLRDFCFWDWNSSYDGLCSVDLKKLQRSEIFHGLGGSMETLGMKDRCCHRVTFGDEDEDYCSLIAKLFEE